MSGLVKKAGGVIVEETMRAGVRAGAHALKDTMEQEHHTEGASSAEQGGGKGAAAPEARPPQVPPIEGRAGAEYQEREQGEPSRATPGEAEEEAWETVEAPGSPAATREGGRAAEERPEQPKYMVGGDVMPSAARGKQPAAAGERPQAGLPKPEEVKEVTKQAMGKSREQVPPELKEGLQETVDVARQMPGFVAEKAVEGRKELGRAAEVAGRAAMATYKEPEISTAAGAESQERGAPPVEGREEDKVIQIAEKVGEKAGKGARTLKDALEALATSIAGLAERLLKALERRLPPLEEEGEGPHDVEAPAGAKVSSKERKEIKKELEKKQRRGKKTKSFFYVVSSVIMLTLLSVLLFFLGFFLLPLLLVALLVMLLALQCYSWFS